MTMLAWHFTGSTLRDGSPIPPVGKWLVHDGRVAICESGLHASTEPFDALQYAPGPILHLVECADIVYQHEDKFVCRRRRILASMDATDILRYFARMAALEATRYWPDVPDVVLDYLMTGDAAIRDAAWWAAVDATGCVMDAAVDAAWAAAWAVAMDAAMDAAMDLARAAAWYATGANFNELVYECFEGPLMDAKK